MGEIARELSQNRWQELSPRFESLARVGSHVSPQSPEIGPRRPCVPCAAFEITRLASIRLPRGTAEWLAKVGRVRSTLAIGDWRSCPSKDGGCTHVIIDALSPKQHLFPRGSGVKLQAQGVI